VSEGGVQMFRFGKDTRSALSTQCPLVRELTAASAFISQMRLAKVVELNCLPFG
jgi:hypothetical protein